MSAPSAGFIATIIVVGLTITGRFARLVDVLIDRVVRRLGRREQRTGEEPS